MQIRSGKSAVVVRVVGPQSDSVLKCICCFLVLFKFAVHETEVVVNLRKFGAQSKCSQDGLDSQGELSEFTVRLAKAVVSGRFVWSEACAFLERSDGFLEPSQFEISVPEFVLCGTILRFKLNCKFEGN